MFRTANQWFAKIAGPNDTAFFSQGVKKTAFALRTSGLPWDWLLVFIEKIRLSLNEQ
jgi:hypothetical protein